MLGIRVIRALEFLPTKPKSLPTPAAVPPPSPNSTTPESTAPISPAKKKRRRCLGTRGRWCNLSGMVGTEPVTITIPLTILQSGFPTSGTLAATDSSPSIRSAKNLQQWLKRN